jgi:hypothetical protein
MSDRRPAAKSFQDLLVWRKAHELVLGIYTLPIAFPKAETYGLSLQLRRSALSTGQYRRRIPAAQSNRKDTVSQPGRELPGGDTVLSDFWLRISGTATPRR